MTQKWRTGKTSRKNRLWRSGRKWWVIIHVLSVLWQNTKSLTYDAFLGTTIRWPLSVERGLKKKLVFFLPVWLGRGMATGLQSNSCPLHRTPFVHSTGPGRVNIDCPTLLSTLVILLCPDQLMVMAHWCCGQSKTNNVNTPRHWSGQEEYNGVDRRGTALLWPSLAPITQAEKKLFFFGAPPQRSTVTWLWSQEMHNTCIAILLASHTYLKWQKKVSQDTCVKRAAAEQVKRSPTSVAFFPHFTFLCHFFICTNFSLPWGKRKIAIVHFFQLHNLFCSCATYFAVVLFLLQIC